MSQFTVPDLDVEMEIYASNNTGEPDRMFKPVLLDKIQWTSTWDCNPSKMTFTTLKDAVINYRFGSKVVLKVNKQIVWVGYVFDKQRNADVKIKNTAYDQVRYLKNRITTSFEGKNTTEIVSTIVKHFSLPMAEPKGLHDGAKHSDCVVDNEEAIQAINEALTRHLTYNQENLSFHDEKGVLVLKSIEDMRVTDQVFYAREMNDFDYTSSISDTYNSILVDVKGYDGETHDRTILIEDEESIKRWGLLRFTDTSNEQADVVKTKAKTLLKLLNRENRTLKLKKVKGNFNVYPGSLVVVDLPLGDFVLKHWMVVKEVTHTIDATGYWMDMVVENSELGFSDPLPPEGHFELKKHSDADTVMGEMGNTRNDTIQATAYNFLRAHGFSAAAACGVMGNMEAESGFDPRAVNQLANGGSDGGYGLCQWTNTQGSPRRDNLFNWCRSSNKDVNNPTSQLEFLIYEYNQPYYRQFLGDRYKRLTNVEKATADFLQYYEGYAKPYEEVQWSRRLSAARKYYNLWKDYDRVPTMGGSGSATGSLMWPLQGGKGSISSSFGWRDGQFHMGTDIAVPTGTPVLAADGGTVLAAGNAVEDWSYGVSVLIKHGNLYTRYAHMALGSLKVKKGDRVSKGQIIGLSNNTGASTGPHLHFEVRTAPDMGTASCRDPMNYLRR